MTANVLQAFTSYSWPGNVRELQHLIESLVVLCPDAAITADQLPAEFQADRQQALIASASRSEGLSLKQAVAQLEIQLIEAALKNSASAAEAAQRLGIDASTLSKKRKRYGL